MDDSRCSGKSAIWPERFILINFLIESGPKQLATDETGSKMGFEKVAPDHYISSF
jgi:hypothetical protein